MSCKNYKLKLKRGSLSRASILAPYLLRHTRTRRTGDGVGAREFRLKRSCVEKHVVLATRRRGSSPRGNVLVERRSGRKHTIHRSHLRRVPTPNVLVERRSGMKHILHSSHLRCVPTPDVLVERRSEKKHCIHSSHFPCVPTPNVLVERRSGSKHIPHISHLRCVPTPNVSVERRIGRKIGRKYGSHRSHFSLCSNSQCLG